jgi:hypothetical protein
MSSNECPFSPASPAINSSALASPSSPSHFLYILSTTLAVIFFNIILSIKYSKEKRMAPISTQLR